MKKIKNKLIEPPKNILRAVTSFKDCMAANIEPTFLKAFTGLIQGNFRLACIFWYKTAI